MTRSRWQEWLDALEPLGLSGSFRTQFEALADTVEPESADHRPTAPRAPGRIVLELRGELTVSTAEGDRIARIPGRLRHRAEDPEDLPAIGDWVVVGAREGDGFDTVETILERSSRIVRKTPGERTEQQVVATNVDIVFAVMGLDGDFNPRRLERFLLTIRDSGASPVVVLTKSDLTQDVGDQLQRVQEVAAGAPVHTVSNSTGEGLAALEQYLEPGVTLALMGSSGVGKSSLVNSLCGEEVMETGAVRTSDDRGKHTTSHRQLVRLPTGALLIDNPGIREIQLWVSQESLESAFPKIWELTAQCRFSDCSHSTEPGCAILAALESGDIPPARWESFVALRQELEDLEARRAARRRSPRGGRRRRRPR